MRFWLIGCTVTVAYGLVLAGMLAHAGWGFWERYPVTLMANVGVMSVFYGARQADR